MTSKRKQRFLSIAHPSRNIDWATGEFAEVRPVITPLLRNTNIVDACDILLAATAEMEEQRRGGTWSTIRKARRRNKRITIFYPDGSVREELRASRRLEW